VGASGNRWRGAAVRGMGGAVRNVGYSYGRTVMEREKKLADAIAWMGNKWVLHPENRIQRLEQPLPPDRTMEPKVLKGVRK